MRTVIKSSFVEDKIALIRQLVTPPPEEEGTMKVSKLLGFLILAILVGLCLSLAPVSAGEHPWNDDQVADTTEVITNDDNQDDDPPPPDNPGIGDLYMGTPLFYLNLLVNGLDSEDNSTPDYDPLGSN